MSLHGVKRQTVLYGIIGAAFLCAVFLPVISMLCRISWKGIADIYASSQFMPAVKNSLGSSLIGAAITLFLALLSAFCIERTNIKAKIFFTLVFTLPMLIPSISHAFGLVALFGANGAITRWLGLSGSAYGFWGIIGGGALYSFPMAFLMFSAILKYEDALPYKAAKILGIPAFNQFTGITLPYLKKTAISVFFAVFTLIITDYGVPLMIGGKCVTLSVLMYNKAVAMMNYDAGSVIGALLLIPAVIAFVVDILNPDTGQAGFVTETYVAESGKVKRFFAYVYCGIISVIIIAPILSFCVMAFATKYPVNNSFTLYHVMKTLNRGAGKYILNSLMYGLLTASVGTAFAFVCAYVTARVTSTWSKLLHLISIVSMAIPGLVLGLSYVIFFNGTLIYGTVLIVVLVNSMHFFSSPYLTLYNTMNKINPNLEDVGLSLGLGKARIIKDVILPKARFALYQSFVYFFVNSMMTISAVSFLSPPSPKPVALMINQFEAQLLMESAAFVSIVILVVNFAVSLVVQIITKEENY